MLKIRRNSIYRLQRLCNCLLTPRNCTINLEGCNEEKENKDFQEKRH